MSDTIGVGSARDALGIPPSLHAVYERLLDRHTATVDELAELLTLRRDQVEEALSDLHSRGFVTRGGRDEDLFVAVSPEIALRPVLARREQEVEDVRLAISEMLERYRTGSTSGSHQAIDVILGRTAVRDTHLRMMQSAQREVLALDRPPFAMDIGSGNKDELGELEVLQRGVVVRAIYDLESLAQPGRPEVLRALLEAGEEARCSGSVPIKLLLVDREFALFPSMRSAQVDSALLVHRSAPLLEALLVLFEMLWTWAEPLEISGQQIKALAQKAEVSEEEAQLLALLRAGLKDDAIARRLNLSSRTASRRIANLLARLGAETRFQAGMRASERGWFRS